MFGSEVLEVGIGMALLFGFVSLIVTAIREFVEGLMQSRAGDLERGIRELLADPDGKGLAKSFYDHPVIYSLFRGDYDPALLGGKEGDKDRTMSRAGCLALPAYIPARHFASALLDIAAHGSDFAERGAVGPVTIDVLRTSVGRIENERVRCALQAAINTAGNDLDAVRANLEDWYNGTMDRVSGWYKKRTQWVVFGIGLATAVVLNVDAITVASRLLSDPALRHAIVAQAEACAAARTCDEAGRVDQASPSIPAPTPSGGGTAEPAAPASQPAQPFGAAPVPATPTASPSRPAPEAGPTRMARAEADVSRLAGQFTDLGFPIGWPPPQLRTCSQRNGQTVCILGDPNSSWLGYWVLPAALGWLITALAIMLGAPFWFDVLNKFMVIRSTVKPTEKSKDESSEDRQTGADGPLKIVLAREKS